jgi:hypothetical protein
LIDGRMTHTIFPTSCPCDLRLGRSDRNLSFWAAAPAKTTYSAASGVEPVAQAARDLEPRRAAATATAADTSIRPFHIRVSDEVLADRRQRIAATKWPK